MSRYGTLERSTLRLHCNPANEADMRVIIRFSLNHDTNGVLRNTLKPILENSGIHWTGATTATYEGDASEKSIKTALQKFWTAIANHTGNAQIDHFWMYSDRAIPALHVDPTDLS